MLIKLYSTFIKGRTEAVASLWCFGLGKARVGAVARMAPHDQEVKCTIPHVRISPRWVQTFGKVRSCMLSCTFRIQGTMKGMHVTFFIVAAVPMELGHMPIITQSWPES